MPEKRKQKRSAGKGRAQPSRDRVNVSRRKRKSSANIEDLVRQSRYIINGTVQKLNAATMSAVTVTPNTAIVKVNEVLQAPQTLHDYTGKDITIQLSDPKGVKEGQQAIFFTNSWLYGESIAVMEVGRMAAGQNLTDLRGQITEIDQSVADQALQSRIERADLVVVGKVVETRQVEGERQNRPMTEHDPDWWQAVIEVEAVEKGQVPGKQIVVLFPNSVDEMWIDSPKFREGQEGIWVFQMDQEEKGFSALRISGYTALNPFDFQTKDQLGRFRALINRPS
jgi:hypothetical protein